MKDQPQKVFTAAAVRIAGRMHQLDQAFQARAGQFFHLCENPLETAKAFTALHVDDYRQKGRPSLRGLVLHHVRELDLPQDTVAYRALMATAHRAEGAIPPEPKYHNKYHYLDVTAMAANLLKKETSLSAHEKTLTLIAALAHDLDHDGASNPPGKPVFNEEKSFQAVKATLEEEGLSSRDIEKIYAIILTTSTSGPHGILREVARAHRAGKAPEVSFDEFPVLKILANDKNLTQMAAIVSDSDLYPSSGAGLKASVFMSALLTAEKRAEDPAVDFTSDAARLSFLDKVVGKEGYISNAGCAALNASLQELRRETARRLRKNKKPPQP